MQVNGRDLRSLGAAVAICAYPAPAPSEYSLAYVSQERCPLPPLEENLADLADFVAHTIEINFTELVDLVCTIEINRIDDQRLIRAHKLPFFVHVTNTVEKE